MIKGFIGIVDFDLFKPTGGVCDIGYPLIAEGARFHDRKAHP